MTAFIKLKKTPIEEIIFTISFNESVSIIKLDEFKALPQISNKFSIVDKGPEMESEAKQRNKIDGYVLKCPASRIIQAQRGSFAFHKVNGYERFEILLKELYEYWSLLVNITGSLTINNLSVRYLNFLERAPNEKNSDVLNIYTTHPFGSNITSSFYQLNLNYNTTSGIVANVITADGDVVKGNGIILDISLDKKITKEQNIDIIFSVFNDMRMAKNEIFFKSITEATIKKYNQ
ncbi:TIGR04255 family protein [Chitinophaga sp. CF118]|uniref:TIGR04255 family protein n=1 Tax=Chitinophaga sp. CF118 TaxID=1884367 RepID=UPI0008F37DA9|nr:TIGR04255 family protein [Chitinophaga sp. CF118]SFD27028.1 TIGR04255 family protein [Chitinophaga sp. CF118]